MERIYLETYGCSLNFADTATMAGILKKEGYEITKNIEESNLIILNTCALKNTLEEEFKKRLKELPQKPLIIAGCIPQSRYGKLKELKDISLIGTHQISRIGEIVEETLNGNIVILLAEDQKDQLNLPHIRENNLIEIIPISAGCKGNCTFCINKLTRGKLHSYNPELIIKRVKYAIQQGVKEIWITSQDIGDYGLDINTTLPELLTQLIEIKGDYQIKLDNINPNHMWRYLDELISIFKSNKIFKYLHIPLQSGNDEVLKNMNRKYSAKDWINIVKKFREEIPEITIATDIICGFPGETEVQFRDTVYLIEKHEPDILNISRFWKRQGTLASKMKQLNEFEIKKRTSWLTRSFEWISFQRNKKWINWEGNILINKKIQDNEWEGRNNSYKQITIKGNYKINQKIKVKIAHTTINDLRAIEIKK